MSSFNALEYFEIRQNCISIAGKSILELLDSNIDTPCYIYSKDIINKKCIELENALPTEIQIYYSLKANPLKSIVDHLSNKIDGFEVSSISELNKALDTNISNENILYTGPGKNVAEINIAVDKGVTISTESINELKKIDEIGLATKKSPLVLIRVNPDFTQTRAGMKMASGPSAFGIDSDQIPEVLNWISNSSINLKGFHIYYGSQILDADAINQSQNKSVDLIEQLINKHSLKIDALNIGGGFGIPYFTTHTPLNLNKIGENLKLLLNRVKDNKQIIQPARPIIELGRYLVGESGIYLCKVIDKKVSRGKNYLIVDGGMHHHLAASGNLGQKNRKNFPVVIANKVKSDHNEIVNIVGKLCTPLDILAEDINLSTAEIGDYIAILQSGAYSFSASPINFLSHPHPNEYFI